MPLFNPGNIDRHHQEEESLLEIVRNCKSTKKPGPCAHDGHEEIGRKDQAGVLGKIGVRAKTSFLRSDHVTVGGEDMDIHKKLKAAGATHLGRGSGRNLHGKSGTVDSYSLGDHDVSIFHTGARKQQVVVTRKKKPTANGKLSGKPGPDPKPKGASGYKSLAGAAKSSSDVANKFMSNDHKIPADHDWGHSAELHTAAAKAHREALSHAVNYPDKVNHRMMASHHTAEAKEHKLTASIKWPKKSTNNSNGATMTKNERKQFIDELVTNGCGCWGEADRELLQAFEPKRLRNLVANARKSAANEGIVTNLRTKLALGESDELTPEVLEVKFTEAVTNCAGDMMDEKKKTKKVAPTANTAAAVAPVTPTKVAPTVNQNITLEDLPEGIQAMVRNAEMVVNEAKQEIINKLVANAKPEDKAELTAHFMTKDLPELKLQLKALPEVKTTQRTTTTNTQEPRANRVSWFGGQGHNEPTVNNANQNDDFDSDDFLPIPTMNFSDN